MHDGLGSTLVGALSVLRSGQGSPAVLQEHLQHALDALKFSVDAMQDTGGDLAAVLGNLRYRICARGWKRPGCEWTGRWSDCRLRPA
ncbi:hypothetical protein ACU4GD_26780 [Cupriavidus basilensis]